MKDVMTDLETYGTRPGCGILSIGAVYFDRTKTLGWQGATYYSAVSRESCLAAGLHEDPSTIKWWGEQGSKARQVWEEVKTARPLKEVLTEFSAWSLNNKKTSMELWGNGADFDNPILSAAYHAVGLKQPWGSFQGRCYRTLKSFAPTVKLVRVGTYHNALDDALSQAEHAVRLFKHLKLA